MDNDGTSNPYAYVTCFGVAEQTKTASKATDAIWEEELQFAGTRLELEGAMVSVAVWDEDFGADDLIGSFSFDLEDVRGRPDKEYYKAWVTLFNPAKEGPQGKVRVSVTILEPGDELPPRPGRECLEEAGQPQDFDLSFKCFCAEGLPQMDRTGLADPYVSLGWCGKKVRTLELSGTLTPEFHQELSLPVQMEGNEEAPPSVDLVIVRVREYNRTGNVDIAYGNLYLKDIKKEEWAAPCWLNLYGAPRSYGDRVLSAPTIKGDPKIVLEQMNTGKVAGNTYRGRLLMSAALEPAARSGRGEPWKSAQDGFIQPMEMLRLDRPPSVVPWRFKQPDVKTGLYTLRVGFLVGCDLPSEPEVFLRVSWGVPKEGASRSIVNTGVGMDQRTKRNPRGTGEKGLVVWNELLTLEAEWPLDPWQVPDVFIELVDQKRNVRTHFLRMELNAIDDVEQMVTGSANTPMLNGEWHTLGASTTEENDVTMYEPHVLMSVGVECDKNIHRVSTLRGTKKKGQKNAKGPQQWHSKRQIKVPHLRQDGLMSDRGDDGVSGDAATLRGLSVGAVRKRATAAGATEGDCMRARDSDDERQTLIAVLLEYLVQNGGHRERVVHGIFDMRVHVYQARGLKVDVETRTMPFVIAQTWGAEGMSGSRQPPDEIATQAAPEGSMQSPRWYETLTIDAIDYPGAKAGDHGLRMAYPLVVSAVQQGSRRGATLLGRLRVPITEISTGFETPQWWTLRLPNGDAAGELLVGFEMYGEKQKKLRAVKTLKPKTTTVNLTAVMVGGRGLIDTNPSLGERFGSTNVRKSKVEFYPGDEEKRSTDLVDGVNPTYLRVETWENLELPEDELYAPSLSTQVFHETGVITSTVLLGTADLNLANHVRRHLSASKQSKRLVPQTSRLAHKQGSNRKPRKGSKGGAYSQLLDSSDESEDSDDSDETNEANSSAESDGDEDDDDAPGESDAVDDDGPRPFFARRQGKAWKRFISHKTAADELKLKASQVAKCLGKKSTAKGLDFKYAVETEGTREMDPLWRVGRRRALDELENCFPELLDTYDDLDIKGVNSNGAVASAGTLKVWVGLSDAGAPVPHPRSAAIATKIEVIVRAYIVRAFRLTALDSGNASDPYVRATIDGVGGTWPKGHPDAGKEVPQDPIPKTLNPYFGQVYEWKSVVVPGTPALTVEVFDDDLGRDELIGRTQIDIEERFFSEEWRELGVGSDGIVRRPSECRDLYKSDSKVTQGGVEMWIEVFPAAELMQHPYVDISPPEKELFELRVVIWDAKEIVPMDEIGDMNDLYFSGHLYYRDSQNRLQETVHETDIHWRAGGGKGSFNYRLLFKDLELPMDDGSGDSDLPRFVIRAWDQDVLGGNDLIGSADIDIKDMFRTAWKRLDEQRGRDEAIEKMNGKQLAQELSEMWDAQYEQAKQSEVTQKKKMGQIEKNRKRLREMDSTKMRKTLLESDPKRMLSHTPARLPDPSAPAPPERSVADDAVDVAGEVAGAVGSVAIEAGSGLCVALQARPSRECCVKCLQCQCLPAVCRWLCQVLGCVWRVTCGCRKRVTDKLIDAIGTDDIGAHKPMVVHLIGPNALSDSDDGGDDDEEAKPAGPTWGYCGQLRIQMELLPKQLAEERPVGKGREEPNQFPSLPEPTGRVEFSLNPIAMLSTLVGPAFATKLLFCLLVVGCCVLLAMMVPLILSNVIAHGIEEVGGIGR